MAPNGAAAELARYPQDNNQSAHTMNTHSIRHCIARPLGSLALLFAFLGSYPAMAGDDDDRGESFRHASPHFHILPPNWSLQGKTYSEWSAKWWQWANSIPIAENPLFGNGEFAQKGSGEVWFLAGAFGGTLERKTSMPAGKWLFFPILNSLWWAPDDLDDAAYVAETFFGLDPNDLTDDELIALIANFWIDPLVGLSLTIDGVGVEHLSAYRTISPGFRIKDPYIADYFGATLSQPNRAMSAGYWIMLAPLEPGLHTIRLTAQTNNPLAGAFALDLTYHLTVGPKKK
jgi:hypothetical protein